MINAVALHVAGELTEDKIFFGRTRIGTTDDRASSPARIFQHRDFLGRRFAESSAAGAVETNHAPFH